MGRWVGDYLIQQPTQWVKGVISVLISIASRLFLAIIKCSFKFFSVAMASLLSGLGLVDGYSTIIAVKKNDSLKTMFKSALIDGFVRVAINGEFYECDFTNCAKVGDVVVKDCYYKLMDVFIKHKSGLMA